MSSEPSKIPASAAPSVAGLNARDLMVAALRSSPASSPAWTWDPPPAEEVAPLFPDYTIEALIGRGGMGAVYRGVQQKLDRPVAIKLLPAELAAQGDLAARFEREARSLAKLSHPNIVLLYDYGRTSAGQLYIIMEYVDGTDLGHLIHAGGDAGKLDVPRALEIVRQICDALQYAHGRGLVHRDIKPGNVLVDRSGCVKVADFGLAKILGTPATLTGQTIAGTMIGTPEYVAPEQLRGGEVDHRADIYSLGVMFYEMLTGDLPRGAWQPPSQRVPAADVRMDEVVTRAMQQEPDRRYQQASEVKGALAARTTAPPGTPVRPGWSDHFAGAALFALGVAASTLLVTWVFGVEWPLRVQEFLYKGQPRGRICTVTLLALVVVLSSMGPLLGRLSRGYHRTAVSCASILLVTGACMACDAWLEALRKSFGGYYDHRTKVAEQVRFGGFLALGALLSMASAYVSRHWQKQRTVAGTPGGAFSKVTPARLILPVILVFGAGLLWWQRETITPRIATNSPQDGAKPESKAGINTPLPETPKPSRRVVLASESSADPAPASSQPNSPAPVGATPELPVTAPMPLPAEPSAESLIARGKEIGVKFAEREGHWYAVVSGQVYASAALSSPAEFAWAAATFAAEASSDRRGLQIGAIDKGTGWQWANEERWTTIPWAEGEPKEPPVSGNKPAEWGWASMVDGKAHARYGTLTNPWVGNHPRLCEWDSLKKAWEAFPRIAWIVRETEIRRMAYALNTSDALRLLEHTLQLPGVMKVAGESSGGGNDTATFHEELSQLVLFFEVAMSRPQCLTLLRFLPDSSNWTQSRRPLAAVWNGHTFAVIPDRFPDWKQASGVAEKLGAGIWCPETKEEMEAVPKGLGLQRVVLPTGGVAEGSPPAWRWLSGAEFPAGFERTLIGVDTLPKNGYRREPERSTRQWPENYAIRAGDVLHLDFGSGQALEDRANIFFKPVNPEAAACNLVVLEWPALPQDIKPAAPAGSVGKVPFQPDVKTLPREQSVLVFPQEGSFSGEVDEQKLPVLSDEEFAAILTEFGLERHDRDGHVYAAGILPWGFLPMDPATLDSAEEFTWAAEAFSKWCVERGGNANGLAFGAADFGKGWQWNGDARWDGIPWAEGEPVKPVEPLPGSGVNDPADKLGSPVIGLGVIIGDKCRARYEVRLQPRLLNPEGGVAFRPTRPRAVLLEWDTLESAKAALREWALAAMIDRARQHLALGDTDAARAVVNRVLSIPAVAAVAGKAPTSNAVTSGWQDKIGAMRDAILLMATGRENPELLPLLPGVVEYGGHTYAVVRQLRWSWEEAAGFASKAKASLVAFETREEADFVVRALTLPSKFPGMAAPGLPRDFFLAAEITGQPPWFKWPDGTAFQAWQPLRWSDGTEVVFPVEFKWPDGPAPPPPSLSPSIPPLVVVAGPGEGSFLRQGRARRGSAPWWVDGWIISYKDRDEGTLLLEWSAFTRDPLRDQEQKVEAARMEMLDVMKAHDIKDVMPLLSGQRTDAPPAGQGSKDSDQRRYVAAKANYERELNTLNQLKEAAAARALDNSKASGTAK